MAAAVWSQRRVAIRYERGDRSVERVVEPLGIVLKSGVWYVLARTDEQLRTYRVSRISAAEIADATFERPAVFDLAETWAESTAAYEQSIPVLDVTLRVRSDRLEWLADALGPTQMRTATVGDDPERDGWARMDVRVESVGEAMRQLLPFGGAVEVLAPQELRDELISRARGVIAAYGEVA
jgi:predicted DNA-binding transcriptional regulator YafY